jgi:uncharacterized protein YqeY
MEFIQKYLPKQMSREEVDLVVNACIEEAGATTMKHLGAVMKLIYTKINPASASKQMTSELVKKALSS